MKIFRWKFIVPAAVIIALLCVFFVFYFDSYLKKAFISAGEAVFGAKVEVGSLKTKFIGLSVNIRDIEIGDKDSEFKNLADIDNIDFGVRFIPLLSKRIIIDNMSVEGFKWGTARKTSCKLPPKKRKKEKPSEESFLSKEMKELKNKAVEEYNAFPGVRKFWEIQSRIKSFSPQSIVDMAGIQSVTTVQNSYVELMGKYDSYNKTVYEIDVKERIDRISGLADAVLQTKIKSAADIQALRNQLSSLNEEKANLEKTYNDLKAVKESLAKDIKEQQNSLGNIKSLIERDVDSIASKLSVPSLDFANISRILFGDIWVQRADKLLSYMTLIRKYMPQKTAEEANKPEPRERLRGSDIIYPVKNKLPALLIANIKLAGTSGGEGKEGVPVTFSGIVKNITSDQKATGQKTVFEIKGGDAGKLLIAEGSFSRLTDVAEDIISFSAEGLDAAKLGIPESDYTPSFEGAKSKIVAGFSMTGGDFMTKAEIFIDGLHYDPSEKNFEGVNQEILKYVNMLWQNISSVSAQARMSISEDKGVETDFKSDIDKQLGQRFNNILKAAVGDVKAQIRNEVTQYVDSQKKVLQSEADKYGKSIQKELDSKLGEAQKKINEIKKLVSDKENEIKKSAAASVSSLLPFKKDAQSGKEETAK